MSIFRGLLLLMLFVMQMLVTESNTKLRVYMLEGPAYSNDIIDAQKIAINMINNDSNILTGFELTYQILNASKSKSDAIDLVLKVSSSDSLLNEDDNSTSIPIILGPPFSSYSTVTAPAANAFQWSLLSSFATAVSLSDTTLFPKYYRTISSDLLNVRGVIQLCIHFNWTSIAVIYTADIYGIYFANGIVELATENDIKTNIITYGRDLDGYKYAAETLKKIDTYIVVVISHPDEILALFQTLQDEGIAGFPYFYIGVNSWFDTASIKTAKINKHCKGFIGATPWVSHNSVPDGIYKRLHLTHIYNAAAILYDRFAKIWENEYIGREITPFALYGFDSMYVLSYTMKTFGAKYNVSELLNMNMTFIGNEINNIILNDISFLGLTGNVSFDKNGDRANGLYSFSNVIDNNGAIKYFGIFSDEFSEIITVNITWPDQFVAYDITPRSHKITVVKKTNIDDNIAIIMVLLSIVSIMMVIIYIILLFINRENPVIRAVSWKLNLLTCIGCIVAYIDIIIYWQPQFDILCNIREWLVVISFTLVFMPLFLKTYRISVIFTGMLHIKTIRDYKLILGVILCLIIDVILLSIFTAIDPDRVHYVNGAIHSIHGLEDEQIIYETCHKEDITVQLVYYCLIGLWKSIQLIFGVYVAMIVSRIGLPQINRFNETKSQLIAISFSVIVFILSSIPIAFSRYVRKNSYEHGEELFYLVISIVALLCGNFVLHSNMLQRFIVIYSKNKDHTQFEKTQQELMNELIADRWRRLSTFKKAKYKLTSQSIIQSRETVAADTDDESQQWLQPDGTVKD